MALIINHNIPAMKAARNLGILQKNLQKSVERLSTGLRINNASDDPAGLAVRELMRADIAATYQGVRNAADALSLVQTADEALGLIDAKLSHMKTLALQATNLALFTSERETINSEYQAMAAEIDRIASSTNFNGVKLLDGTMNAANNGRGLMVHFGIHKVFNEDYYFIRTDDARATTSSGLRIGGDGKTDIWSAGAYPGLTQNGLAGCCGGGFSGPQQIVQTTSVAAFMYGYNWDNTRDADATLLSARYVAGRYLSNSGATLEEIVNLVNGGTQSRVGVKIASDLTASYPDYTAIILGNDEAYFVGDETAAAAATPVTNLFELATGDNDTLATKINQSSKTFWAMIEGDYVYVFARNPGDHNAWKAQERGTDSTDLGNIFFLNVDTGQEEPDAANFSLGGQQWAQMELNQTGAKDFAVALVGKYIGAEKDLWIANSGDAVLNSLTGLPISTGSRVIEALRRSVFTELQNAADGAYAGAHVRTQEAGQVALEAVTQAIEKKDRLRTRFGSLATRLEATIEALNIQAENLQTAESNISDLDIAKEMTEFTKNQILTEAATAILAQANSLSSLVLNLL
jgi:flagellin